MRRPSSLVWLAAVSFVAAGAVGWADDPPPPPPPRPAQTPAAQPDPATAQPDPATAPMRDPTGGRPRPPQPTQTYVAPPPPATPPVLRALVQVRGQAPSALIEVGGRMVRIVEGAQFRHPEPGGSMRVIRLAGDGVVIEDTTTLEKVTLR